MDGVGISKTIQVIGLSSCFAYYANTMQDARNSLEYLASPILSLII